MLTMPGDGAAPASSSPSRADQSHPESRVATLRVAALVVTWNRKAAVDAVLQALARQSWGADRLDVVVVDNGSTDGTPAYLAERWSPTAIIDNPTSEAHKPEFARVPSAAGDAARPCPFASLSIVRNRLNHGGCGGFNTALAYAEQYLSSPERPLDYVWLVDDDVDLPENALAQLARTAESDPVIGLVGSRTVDFQDRQSTIETTIYFDHEQGWMGPEPTPGHRLAASHAQWVKTTGGTRGRGPFTGVREVDVVSACSLLARWSAVQKVGFWDHRYFIYCDDADWCLRFAKAGYRIVCDLDAVVYHTIWLSKLTPSRGYYASRNLIWLLQKNFTGRQLRRATLRRLGAQLLESRKAATHCRLFHAEIFRRTAHDVVTGRGGKLNEEGPAFRPMLEALDSAGVLRADAHVAVMCSHSESAVWADELRYRLAEALRDRGAIDRLPRFTYVCRDHVPPPVPVHGLLGAMGAPRRVVFSPNRWSKLGVQQWLFRDPPRAVVVFDQHNECPILWSRCNIHIDRRRPNEAQVERDGWLVRARFAMRWAWTAVRSLWYGLHVEPHVRSGKYG